MDRDEADRARYHALVRRAELVAVDCVHGQPAGDLVRPWCNTPACPWCRRRNPVHWRRMPLADPRGIATSPGPSG